MAAGSPDQQNIPLPLTRPEAQTLPHPGTEQISACSSLSGTQPPPGGNQSLPFIPQDPRPSRGSSTSGWAQKAGRLLA